MSYQPSHPEGPRDSSLIVDFPSLPRWMSIPQPKKELRFSDKDEVKILNRDDDYDSGATWYSKSEYKKLKKSLMSEIRTACRDLAEMSPNQSALPNKLSENEGPCTLGIESYVPESTSQEVFGQRVDHVNAVLDEQDRQDKLRIWDPAAIAAVSQIRSKCSRDRAERNGRANIAA